MKIYDYISILPRLKNPTDWVFIAKEGLEKIIKENNPKTIIEVGSYLGNSAIFMASISNAQILCIDKFSIKNGENDKGYPLDNQLHGFLSNVKLEGYEDRITPLKMTSLEASKIIDKQVDMIYIDADHSEEGCYEDIKIWLPKVKNNGIICGDDYADYWPGVKLAVERARKDFNLNFEIYSYTSFWWAKVS